MPKQTFYNLNPQKQDKILEVLSKTFQEKPIFEVKVKDIVDKLEIARGSFYQYFENLEEAYFYLLEKKTIDTHQLFLIIMRENAFDLFSSLSIYGQKLQDILFAKDNYRIYKNRYLYWTPDLEKAWKTFRENAQKTKPFPHMESSHRLQEEIHFVKAVIHNLIERSFLEKWGPEDFIAHYNQHLIWIKGGIENHGTI